MIRTSLPERSCGNDVRRHWRTRGLTRRAYLGAFGSLYLMLSSYAAGTFAGETTSRTPASGPDPLVVTRAAEDEAASNDRGQHNIRDEGEPIGGFDEEDVEPFEGRFRFNGEFEASRNEIENLSLGERARDDEQVTELEIQAAFSYRPSERLSVFAEIKLIGEDEAPADETPRTSQGELERGETWVYLKRVFDSPYSVKIGRQNFVEPRRWWWDDDLDAVRVYYAREAWRLYAGIAEELARTSSRDDFVDPDQDDVLRLIAQGNWEISESLNLTAFYLRQRDNSGHPPVESVIETEREDKSDADLDWLGVRATGELSLPGDHTLNYWLDLAFVDGDELLIDFEEDAPHLSLIASEETRKVEGWGFDLGASWALALPGEPTLRLNYAVGSGDDNLDDDTDRSFRQTGLQDPDEEFRFYGELLRPELSNLRVATLTLGLPIHGESRLALGYHRFRQVDAAPFLRETRLDAEPAGASRDIGREISLVIELREWENLEIDVAAATFKSGDAFGTAADERSNSVFVQLTYEF